MGRPREHHQHTAAALLDAAERIVEEDGVDALSIRQVAGASSETTRAVYSLFGSKDGLVVALGRRASGELLGTEIEALPATSDPPPTSSRPGSRVPPLRRRRIRRCSRSASRG
jgi:AcrR family transcriptional regulator